MVKRPNFVGRAAVATRWRDSFLRAVDFVGDFVVMGKVQYSREQRIQKA